MLSSAELRQKYLDFFKSKKHEIIGSASLVPENDPTVLFTTAGMHPLVPYLLGEKHPAGNRLANVQKCVRTGDIDEVGDSSHFTFFEMLGNWSLGDYFKEDSILWSFEFLTDKKWLGLDIKKLAVSVFEGDNDASRDDESANMWKKLGMPENRIAYLPKKNNWWGPAGLTGPCGPDTEIFYWRGKTELPPEDSNPKTDEDNWLEIWNNVFMEYEKSYRTILVDGMYTLYDENFVINNQLLELLNKYPQAKKILVVNGNSIKAKELVNPLGFEVVCFEGELKKDNPDFFKRLFEKYNLNVDGVLYFDHAEENISGAKEANIKNIKLFNDSIEDIKELLDNNLVYFKPLKQKNVDTGMGMERTIAVLNGFTDTYQIDTMWPLIQKIEEISGREYIEDAQVTKAMRVIADHLRTATMIMGDNKGIAPSNVDQGYIVRRLIRRAVRYGKMIGLKENFCSVISQVVIEIFGSTYPELNKNKDFILTEMGKEESKFRNTIEQGIKEFEKLVEGFRKAFEKTGKLVNQISGKQAFKLYDTYGFPLEMTLEMGIENGLTVDVNDFECAFKRHQELSRAGAEQKFKGGLADTTESSTKYHTATHLMHAALRKVLGDHVEQRGSNITAERLRFDFSHPEKMTEEQKREVEGLVNIAIAKNYPVSFEEMSVSDAKKKGAMGLFEDKYGASVKVYTVGSGKDVFSKEICGGPHVENTGDLGKFKIIKEEAVSAGIRRIKAILE